MGNINRLGKGTSRPIFFGQGRLQSIFIKHELLHLHSEDVVRDFHSPRSLRTSRRHIDSRYRIPVVDLYRPITLQEKSRFGDVGGHRANINTLVGRD